VAAHAYFWQNGFLFCYAKEFVKFTAKVFENINLQCEVSAGRKVTGRTVFRTI
jgi:hypothetical protein